MPYFVYKIQAGAIDLVKGLELQAGYEAYPKAKRHANELREQDADAQVKIIFAASELEAEERLQEHREAPILAEWEK